MTTSFEQWVQMAPETDFAEVSSVFDDYSIPVISEPSENRPAGRGTDRARQVRMSITRPGHNGSRSGATLDFETYLPGALTDTATGSLAADYMHLLLSAALGGGDLSGVGGVAGATATATSMPNTTGTSPRGHIVRVGQQLDGRANGQAAVIGNPATALLTGLPAAPGATDKVRAAMMTYLDTDAAPPSFRFLVGTRDPGGLQRHGYHGCVALPPTFVWETGGLPTVRHRFMAAYWGEQPGAAIPDPEDLPDCDPALTSGGSYFMNALGTATRAEENAISRIEIAFNGTLIPVPGQGGRQGRYQHHIGYRKSKSSPEDPIATMRITFPYGSSLLDDFDEGDGSDATFYHFLATPSAGDGDAGGEGRHAPFYIPKMYLLERPSALNENQLPYMTALFGITDGPDTTNALTRSPFRLGRS